MKLKALAASFMAFASIMVVAPSFAQSSTFKPVTEADLATQNKADWLHWRGNNEGWGHAPSTLITPENVGDLQLSWGWAMEPGVQQIAPIVHNGIMYLGSPGSVVHALDAVTGDLIWEYRRQMPEGFSQGALHRGLAIFEDKIYVSSPDAVVVALDARSGQVVWESSAGDHTIGKRLTAAPIIADGKVIVGMQGCFRFVQDKCGIVAFDANSGEELWRRLTIEQVGENEKDTWNDVPYVLRGGGDVWTGGTYDPELGLVYYGIAQAKPWARASRGYDDETLYTNSTLAIKVSTGEVEWYRQYIPGESNDMDEAFEHILIDIDGQPSYVNMGKLAVLWRGNRATGESLPAFDLGWQDQIDIDPTTGRFVDYREGKVAQIGEAISFCPSVTGFKSWRALAYSPEARAVYVPMSVNCDAAAVYAEVEMAEGGGGPGKPGRNDIYHPNSPEHGGRFVAMSVDTGEVLWEKPLRTTANTAMLTTAGGVVFGGDWDRNFYAFDQKSGEELWHTRLPQAAQGSPISYEIDGVQYVAVPVGQGGASWSTSVPAKLAPEVKRPSGGNSLLVFALNK